MSPAAAFGSAARRVLPGRPATTRAGLRTVPTAALRSRRAPFVVLVLLLLGVGLVGLLVLNTSLQQASFELTDLERETTVLRDRQTALAEEAARRAAPGSLADRARSLGMVLNESPVFLDVGPEDVP
jgi:cell division protein FtsB